MEVQQELLLGAPESGQALETMTLLVCTSSGLGKRPISGIRLLQGTGALFNFLSPALGFPSGRWLLHTGDFSSSLLFPL